MDNRCSWTLTTGPTQEPVTLLEAHAQMRMTHHDEDPLVRSYIKSAREMAESFLGRGLFTQSWTFTAPQFWDRIWLPMAGPLQSVTWIKYNDTAGAQQTLSASVYLVDTVSLPGRVTLAPGQAWPAVQADRDDAVQIRYVVGWATVATIPERFKQGIRLAITAMDADRDGLNGQSSAAVAAAENCWRDRMEWRPPEYWT